MIDEIGEFLESTVCFRKLGGEIVVGFGESGVGLSYLFDGVAIGGSGGSKGVKCVGGACDNFICQAESMVAG